MAVPHRVPDHRGRPWPLAIGFGELGRGRTADSFDSFAARTVGCRIFGLYNTILTRFAQIRPHRLLYFVLYTNNRGDATNVPILFARIRKDRLMRRIICRKSRKGL